ncbi:MULTISPECIES: hypothetical protein [Pseudomonas]|uniref:Uncharacterized protein n=1 Tax=Pseudomonas luteola TaxID=47886 RepID=A0ABS0FNB1_PSELU|nr:MULTISPECIES: hypothetical protein [Pseudomonas]MBF8641817.1 hypothetical protein [Pseudomonas zeshuii]RRW48575.1 hypothetical protein EGJ50_08350 [Pseudomonas luteola]SHI92794.1 hypothetical protein SAMN05216295_10575 [Pseudomonas zeshuii]
MKKKGVTLHCYFLHIKPDKEGLRAIYLEAKAIAERPYNPEDGMPANVIGIAFQIANQALTCMAMLESKEAQIALSEGFKLGSLCGELNTILAAWSTLEEQKAYSDQHKAAAIKRHSKPGGSKDLREKIRTVWASGKYSSRDICAEQEWAGLGYNSFSAARKALSNTPDPT